MGHQFSMAMLVITRGYSNCFGETQPYWGFDGSIKGRWLWVGFPGCDISFKLNRMGPPQLCLLVYKAHEYYSYIYHKPLLNHLCSATERDFDWGPHPVGNNVFFLPQPALLPSPELLSKNASKTIVNHQSFAGFYQTFIVNLGIVSQFPFAFWTLPLKNLVWAGMGYWIRWILGSQNLDRSATRSEKTAQVWETE